MSVKILLVDDHRILREGLRTLLEQEGGMTVVGEAADGRTAVALAHKLKPDVVIMDIAMPQMSGIDATRAILAALPQTRVIALTMNSAPHFVEGMLRAGVAGYVLKECAGRDLLEAIKVVMAGGNYLSPSVTAQVVSAYKGAGPAPQPNEAECLTPTELKVLRLLAEGQRNKEIAAELDVSLKSIENHRAAIMKKLDLHSMVDLTKFAIRTGLISLDDKETPLPG